MDRIAALIVRANTLRIQVYSSRPFADRLAEFFTRLALDTQETLGRALGAEFLLKGVTGMPDPGQHWKPESRNPASTLPSGYMRDYASKVYGLLMKKFHDPELVDDAIQTVLMRVMKGEGAITPGMSLEYARNLVTKSLVNAAIDIVRHRRRRKEVDLEGGGEESDAGRSLEEIVEDPRAFANIHRELSPRVWKLWMEHLAKHLHPDIPAYIGLSMQGLNNDEIIGNPQKNIKGELPTYVVPPSGPKAFLYHFVYPGGPQGGIPGQTKKFFESLHEELPAQF